MQIPIRRVVRKSDGHECSINELDYQANPSLYELPGAIPSRESKAPLEEAKVPEVKAPPKAAAPKGESKKAAAQGKK